MFLVGGRKSLSFPPSKLVIWDDDKQAIVGEIRFNEEIKALKLRRDIFCVVFEEKIYVYNTPDLTMKDIIETCTNPRGLCCLSTTSEKTIMACPYVMKGKVTIKNYNDDGVFINIAHDSALACMELNFDGSILACASDKGTLIRLFDTETFELLYELRRGIDKADIYSIAFHPTSEWIACSSDKGTIHIYSTGANVSNHKLNLAFMKSVLPKYFKSEWSYAHFRIKGTKTICCFAKDNCTVILLTATGDFYAINYSNPGECKTVEIRNLFEVDEDIQ